MQEKPAPPSKNPYFQENVKRIIARIIAMDFVCSGTIVTTLNKCGKPTCRCATDLSTKHGPYHQWNRMKKGKLIHRTVSAQQAAQLRKATRNYRAVLRLLRVWEEEPAKILDVKPRPK